MRGNKFGILLCAAAVAVLMGGFASAQDEAVQDPQMAAMMEAMAKAATPGEPHEYLKQMEGVWDAQARLYGMGPEPVESRGLAQSEMILGGRYLQTTYKGDFMGEPFVGMAFEGYDNTAKKYVGMWIDTASTVLMTTEGELEEDETIRTMYGSFIDPATGKEKHVKAVTTILTTSRFTYEAFEKTGDGEYVRTMQIIFSRK